jgi:hypothetical protein
VSAVEVRRPRGAGRIHPRTETLGGGTPGGRFCWRERSRSYPGPRCRRYLDPRFRTPLIIANTRIEQAPEFPRHAPPVNRDGRDFHRAGGGTHLHTECARIWNPIHTERRAALAAGAAGHRLTRHSHVGACRARDHRPIRTPRPSATAASGRAISRTGDAGVDEYVRRRPPGRSMEFTVRNSAGAPAIASGRAPIDSGDDLRQPR